MLNHTHAFIRNADVSLWLSYTEKTKSYLSTVYFRTQEVSQDTVNSGTVCHSGIKSLGIESGFIWKELEKAQELVSDEYRSSQNDSGMVVFSSKNNSHLSKTCWSGRTQYLGENSSTVSVTNWTSLVVSSTVIITSWACHRDHAVANTDHKNNVDFAKKEKNHIKLDILYMILRVLVNYIFYIVTILDSPPLLSNSYPPCSSKSLAIFFADSRLASQITII